jgi:hypothetical protein
LVFVGGSFSSRNRGLARSPANAQMPARTGGANGRLGGKIGAGRRASKALRAVPKITVVGRIPKAKKKRTRAPARAEPAPENSATRDGAAVQAAVDALAVAMELSTGSKRLVRLGAAAVGASKRTRTAMAEAAPPPGLPTVEAVRALQREKQRAQTPHMSQCGGALSVAAATPSRCHRARALPAAIWKHSHMEQPHIASFVTDHFFGTGLRVL